MSQIVGASQLGGAELINSVGNAHLGRANLNSLIANMSLISLVMTTFRDEVKTRSSFDSEYDYIISK